MSTATYPDDAIAPITAFSVIGAITYNNTSTTREFALPSTVTNKGEVTAFQEGVLQSTSSYSLAAGGDSITFLIAPNATQLIIKTISFPSTFRVLRKFPKVVGQDYASATVTVNGNNFTLNGITESFSLPAGVNVTSSSDFMVYVSGIFQQESAYSFPSTALGSNGIDIGDNSAVKLLTNFASNLTDISPSPHTVAINSGSATFSASNVVLDATKYISTASSDDFAVGEETSFTIDTIVTPDSGASMSANQTLLSRFQNSSNYYMLRTVGTNSNVGFVVNHEGTMTEVYGGNCNGGTTYNVAVSYDKVTSRLRLYVQNSLVGNVAYTPSVNKFSSGPLVIGANAAVAGGSAASQERFKGKMEYMRLAKVAKLRDATAPGQAFPTTATVIGGAPLGASDIADTLSVRVFDAEVTETDRFNSMADRKPDAGFSTEKVFGVETFTSQAGYEKRRLQSRRPLRSYKLQYTNITGVERTAIENFYNARSGTFESFSFDLSHLNESGIITTRFDGALAITQVLSAGTALTENFFTVSFNLKETFD
jgi:hypothetical protein|tara:strand:- start:1818 stop:3434 length:1617 start_codon:yes stop_codon:yes gene_type:complete